jgi:type IX secretion system PorP/SprF family membrane protein
MKQYLTIILGIIGCTLSVSAQQLPQFTQYQLNDYIINPAVAGSRPYFEAKSNNRYQWEGIQDAPRTFTLGVNGPLKNQNMGVGGYIFVDVTGPTKRTGLSLSYSYHVNLTDDIRLSLAANGGITQFSLDGAEITLEDQTDDAFINNLQNELKPDAGFSFYLYGKNFYFGGSAPSLIQRNLEFEDVRGTSGRIVNHYYLMAGYTYEINNNFKLDPSAIVRFVDPIVQFEATLRATYLDQFSAGISYRQEDAIAMLLGFTLNNTITFGYSYDFIQSDIMNYSTGSHEFMVGIRFNDTGIRATRQE